MATKIFIDQGHNPVNPNAGAEGQGLREQDITYNIGTLLAEKLRSNPNFEVMLSRNDPDEILGRSNTTSLAARVMAANNWCADYFISLHTNASSNSNASGSEAYAYSESSNGYRLGEEIVGNLSEATGMRNRGVFVRPSLYVLRRTYMPSVLVEMGFITNPEDARIMSQNPDLVAQGIYNGILSYFAN